MYIQPTMLVGADVSHPSLRFFTSGCDPATDETLRPGCCQSAFSGIPGVVLGSALYAIQRQLQSSAASN
jgi:hypothetical protein